MIMSVPYGALIVQAGLARLIVWFAAQVRGASVVMSFLGSAICGYRCCTLPSCAT